MLCANQIENSIVIVTIVNNLCNCRQLYIYGNYGKYAAFGNVLEGLDTVDKIVAQKTDSNDKPLTDQVIKYLRVATFEKTVAEPETLHE